MKLHIIGRAGGGVSRRFLKESLTFIEERLPALKAPSVFAPGLPEAGPPPPLSLSGRSGRRSNPSSFPGPPTGIKERSAKSEDVLNKRLFPLSAAEKGRPATELSLTVAFLSEKAMRDLNFRFRGQNKPTDVLSFAPLEEGGFGEIALYCDPKRAARLKLTVKQEIFYLLLHGVLHLSGFRHDREPEASCMFALQDRIFEQWLSVAKARPPQSGCALARSEPGPPRPGRQGSGRRRESRAKQVAPLSFRRAVFL